MTPYLSSEWIKLRHSSRVVFLMAVLPVFSLLFLQFFFRDFLEIYPYWKELNPDQSFDTYFSRRFALYQDTWCLLTGGIFLTALLETDIRTGFIDNARCLPFRFSWYVLAKVFLVYALFLMQFFLFGLFLHFHLSDYAMYFGQVISAGELTHWFWLKSIALLPLLLLLACLLVRFRQKIMPALFLYVALYFVFLYVPYSPYQLFARLRFSAGPDRVSDALLLCPAWAAIFFFFLCKYLKVHKQ